MNIQIAQLKYLLALAESKSYSQAASQCNVSQPALSMAIKKMEEDLGLVLIDRTSSPINLTDKGVIIANQAMKILEEYAIMEKTASDLLENRLSGSLRLSIIPTLAPYFVPLFIKALEKAQPDIQLIVEEQPTATIIQKLKTSEIDAGLLVTPLDEKSLVYEPLFFEEFFLYANPKIDKSYIVPEDIDFKNLWLLEEGHCMRHQMMKICELKKLENPHITYNAGSIESLINITDASHGMTIIPELATWHLSPERKQRVVPFQEPTPVREVSMIHHKFSAKMALIRAVNQIILDFIPSYMKIKESYQRVDITPV
jgi:LysR family hydrogen peroxide-inducible transcriptional activator